MSGDTLISILRRLLEADQGDLPVAAAEAILRLRVSEKDQSRMDELGEKCNFGTLTPEESAEYEAYVSAADFVALWQSKARLSLKHQSTAA